MEYTRLCSGFSSNLNLMALDFYETVSSLAVSFAHFLLGLLKRILPRCFFLLFYFCTLYSFIILVVL